MALQISFLAIDYFPLILLVSIAFAFTFLILLRPSEAFQKSKPVQLLIRRAKHIFLLSYGGGYAFLLISLGLAAYTNSELWISMYFFLDLYVIVMNIVLLGFLLGLIFAASFSIGISLFLFISLLVFSVGLLPLYFDALDFAVFFLEEFADVPFLLFFLLPGTDCVTKRMLGIEEPNQEAKNRATLEVASIFISNCFAVIKKRMKDDTDDIIHEINQSLLDTSGPKGDLIRSIESGEREILSPSEVVGSLVSPNQLNYSSFQRRNASKTLNLKPRGPWTLTNAQFFRRVLINRVMYFFAFVLIIIIVVTNLPTISSPFSYWMTFLSIGLLVVSIPLSVLDCYFTGKRISSEKVKTSILQSLDGIEDILEVISDKEVPISEDIDTDTQKPLVPISVQEEVMHEGYIENAPKELRTFLQRVKENKYSIHEEDIFPIYTGAAGFLLSIPTLMVFAMTRMFSGMVTFFDIILLTISGIGIPLILFGAVSWYLMTKKRRFRGLRRHWTSIGLSFLDAKEYGVESVGHIIMPPPPRQYIAFNMAGSNSARILLQHLEETLGEIDPRILRDSYETQLRMTKVIVPMFLIMGIFFPIMSFGMPEEIRFIFIALSIFIVLGGIGMAIDLLRKRSQLDSSLEFQSEDALDSRGGTVSAILRTMRQEYEYPLRLMMSQFHQELIYTGMKYSTNTGHTLHEALFIPTRFISTLSTIYQHRLDA